MDQILGRIQDRWERLTASEERLARWVEQHLDTLAFETANELARRSGVSESTVVRFARKLDYASYPDMQRAAQRDLQERFSLGDRFRASLEDDEGDALAQTYARDLDNLHATYDAIDRAAFAEALRLLAGPGRVAVVGLRASAAPAVYLAFALNLVRSDVARLSFEFDDHHDQLLDYRRGDVLVAFSLARPARRTLKVVREAKGRYGMTVIAVTDSYLSPLAQYADLALLASAQGTFNSYTAIMSLCGALVSGVAASLRERAESRLRQLDTINREDVLVDE